VPAVSLPTAFANVGIVDFLHVDIQGSEAQALPAAIDFLTSNVRTMVVGTHSRKIEGDLIEFFRSHKWTLVRERPCQFHCAGVAPSLEGLTYFDGEQLWMNENI
jgi:hypothetical protein